MRKNTGGMAFPLMQSWRKYGDVYEVSGCDEGMTLRDYFAAKVIQGWLGSRAMAVDGRQVAAAAYILADAMIAEREKER